jgi:hypothetical protein
MIKGLMGGTNVIVSGGNTSVPYVSQNNANPMQGMLRIWGSDMQVFDGNTWMNLSTSYATVDLSPESQTLLQWAREQKNKQADRETRIKNNPALQKAFENIKRAEENFELIDALVKDYIHNEETTQGP